MNGSPPLRRAFVLEICGDCRQPLDHRHAPTACRERAAKLAARERFYARNRQEYLDGQVGTNPNRNAS